ncbi:MAG: hypothetical protein NTZ67_04545 [Gammaproteobacteria bacterium]|nr:hypothetical protein [Gammaproteobacteria bacterium]
MRTPVIDIDAFSKKFSYITLVSKEAKTRFGRFLMAFKNTELTKALTQIAMTLQFEIKKAQSNKSFLEAIDKALKNACMERWEAFEKKNPNDSEILKLYYYMNTHNHISLSPGRFEKEIIRCLTLARESLNTQQTILNLQNACTIDNADIRRINQLIEQAKNPNTIQIIDRIVPGATNANEARTSGLGLLEKNPFDM